MKSRSFSHTSCFIIVIIFMFSLPALIPAQEVVISGFPVGVAGSVDSQFFEPYYPQLQHLADTLKNNPLLQALVVGGADGETFQVNNDAKNPALALGRAHALKSLLLRRFGIDSSQITIQTEDTRGKGAEYRYASVRIIWQMNDLKARLDNLANREPIVMQPITQVTEIHEAAGILTENMGLQFSAGLSSSPYGGIPIISGAIVWGNRIYIEAILGHSLWNSSFDIYGEELETRRRVAAGVVKYFPFKETRLGFLAGWLRAEEIAQRYYEYVKMSEGPMLGATYYPINLASITVAYNPVRQRTVGNLVKEDRTHELMISTSFHIQFGGGK